MLPKTAKPAVEAQRSRALRQQCEDTKAPLSNGSGADNQTVWKEHRLAQTARRERGHNRRRTALQEAPEPSSQAPVFHRLTKETERPSYVRGELKLATATWPARGAYIRRHIAARGHLWSCEKQDQRRRKMGRRGATCNPLAEDTAGAERHSDGRPRAADCVFGYYPAGPTGFCPA